METWKEIPGFEGYYEASDHGRIRSMERRVALGSYTGLRTIPSHVLKPYKSKNGYLMLVLSCDGKRSKCLVHRLVASAFLGDRLELDVNHKNLNKTDNRVQNLEWVTKSENMQHAHDNGAFPPEPHRRPLLCKETGEIFQSSYKAAEWVNSTERSYTGQVSGMAGNIRKAARTGKRAFGYHWSQVERKPSTTIPNGSTPKWVEMGSPS